MSDLTKRLCRPGVCDVLVDGELIRPTVVVDRYAFKDVQKENEMKPLVIYHANCTDGFGAAFAAWLKLGDEAEYLPMEYLKATDGVAEILDTKELLAAATEIKP